MRRRKELSYFCEATKLRRKCLDPISSVVYGHQHQPAFGVYTSSLNKLFFDLIKALDSLVLGAFIDGAGPDSMMWLLSFRMIEWERYCLRNMER
jgi:hypothetical protein